MFSKWTATAIIGASLGLGLCDGAGQAGPAAASREEILTAFAELKTQADAAFPKNDFADVPVFSKGVQDSIPVFRGDVPKLKGVQIGADKAKVILKVWAMPLKDGKIVQEHVNLGKRIWAPGEEFYIFLESAVPLQLICYEKFETPPGKAKIRRIPDPQFPQSFQTIRPGKRFKFPVAVELDPGFHDELMCIVAITPGVHEDLPPKVKGNYTFLSKDGTVAKDGARYIKALEAKAAESFKGARAFKTTTPAMRNVPVPNDGFVTSNDPDDVAILAYGPESFGHFDIRIKKRP